MSNTHTETRAFEADVAKALELVIHSLYTNKEIFVRELISNASDACDKIRYNALSNSAIVAEDLKISVKVNKAENSISIIDNGIGMNREELIQNLGTIAHSGTRRFMEALEQDKSQAAQLIGQFGVGFYSAYMVAQKVKVQSTKAGEDTTYIWESDGLSSYTITQAEEKAPTGTVITVFLKDDETEYVNEHTIKNIIKTYADHIAFPIFFQEDDKEPELANKASALWSRTKSEISDEEYQEFYHHIAHSPDTPWMIIHNKAEGAIEYTCLLYIPGVKPHDLLHPDFKTRVKLYVKKVYITDDAVDIIPTYLRFLRGVIDSEDLPLNVSRETLQNTQLLNKIKQSIVNKILNLLHKKSTEEPESYIEFWNNFGEVIKEGLCGASPEKPQILSICRFRTTKSGDKLISLNDYVLNMAEGQEDIFYLNGGNNIDNMISNPILEGFIKRDIEVILLSDHVDDFWVNIVTNHQGKSIVSVTSSNIDLDKIKPLPQETEEQEKPKQPENIENIISCFKEILGSKVKDVVVSPKLVDSPSSLAIPEGSMHIRMEKFMIENKQLKKPASKILEINPHHPILCRIGHLLTAGHSLEDPEVVGIVQLVFDQACLTSGEGLADQFAFVRNINMLLSKTLPQAD